MFLKWLIEVGSQNESVPTESHVLYSQLYRKHQHRLEQELISGVIFWAQILHY